MTTLTSFLDKMPAFDIFVIAFLLFATFMGGIRGIFSQVTSLISLVLSWYLASRYYSLAVPFIPLADPLRGTVAIFAVFIILFMTTRLISRMMGKTIHQTVLKEVNRQLGALFGLAKGFLFCLVITFFAVIVSSQTRNLVIHSQSGRMMVRVISAVQKYVPENEHHQKILDALNEFNKAATDANTPTPLEEQIASFKQEIETSIETAEEKGNELNQTLKDVNTIADAIHSFGQKSSFTNDSSSSVQTDSKNKIDDALSAAHRIFSSGSFRSVSLVEGDEKAEETPISSETSHGGSPVENIAVSVIDGPKFSISVTAPPF